MGLLQYTSNEMFSSTELVRKNKYIFDKLNKNEIEKAIILRDGKPGIILMDFNHYEQIIREYLELKETEKENIRKKKIEEELRFQKTQSRAYENKDEINNEELQTALDKIDKINFDFDSTKTNNDKAEPLKEFWD
jgi:outer membrane protein OmpA-like peptidoglycan-associated protein